ncbi:MAG TPA: hypothetical protein PKC67_02570 [Kiritimatiellia bacterium]|nr:hypothetical protein [Kiritimatiellia bacterium]HMP33210.1 hypothetical protein [Kiritimatiellia bacterium]
MLISRPMIQAALASITSPRSQIYKLQDGKVWLMDKKTGQFQPIVLKNRVIHVMEPL